MKLSDALILLRREISFVVARERGFKFRNQGVICSFIYSCVRSYFLIGGGVERVKIFVWFCLSLGK